MLPSGHSRPLPAQIEVVEGQRLLEHRVVALLAERHHGLAVVEHVVAAHLVGAVGQAGRMLLGGGPEQDLGAIGRAGRDHHDVGLVDLVRAVARYRHARDGPAGRVGLQPLDLRVDQQGHVRLVQRRADRDDLGVGLGVHQARVAVAPRAADALAGGPVGLIQQDAARRVERVVAARCQGLGDLLDPRLVRDGRPRVLLGPVALGGILAVVTVHLVQPLGLGVPGLEVVVAQRPGRRQAVGVLELAEVLGPQPVQRGAVQLGGTADEIVHLRLERLAGRVEPGLRRDVPAVHEHRAGTPVLHLALQEVAALKQQDPLAGRGQGVRERAPAGAAADDDDVIVVSHSPNHSPRPGRAASPLQGDLGAQPDPPRPITLEGGCRDAPARRQWPARTDGSDDAGANDARRRTQR